MENNKLETTKASAFTTPEPTNNTSSSSSSSSCSSASSGGGNSNVTSRKRKYSDESQEKDGNCSYTSMIAQAIMKTPFKRATLSEIYNYMSNAFDILKKRGNGWRNCVRHTLSLNECFVKLNRPENGRSCNWTVHPSYFEAFLRGDYRKRRSNRKKVREAQWIPDNRCMNFGTPTSLPYLQSDQMNSLRQTELERMAAGQQNAPVPPPPPSIWHSYVSALESNIPKTTIPQDMAYAYHNMYNESIASGTADKNSPPNPLSNHPPAFSIPGYPLSSPSTSEYAEHHSGTIDGHTSRMRYSRSCGGNTPTFACKSNGGERLQYENMNRAPPYGSHDQIPPPHFPIDSTCYGNFSSRSYRTDYF